MANFSKIISFLLLVLQFSNCWAEGVLRHTDESDSISTINLAIVFDSIKTSDFFPLFTTKPFSYKEENDFSLNTAQFDQLYQANAANEKLRRRFVNRQAIEHPEVIDYYNLKPYDPSIASTKVDEKKIRITNLEEKLNRRQLDGLDEFIKAKRENSPWKFTGNLSIQFSQYYVTSNWYKGGTPNASLLTLFDYKISYKKDKLIWNNDFDIKIGFYNSSEDTLRPFRVNNDVFKIRTMLDYETWFYNKIYYSGAIELKTSLFTNYKGSNTDEVVVAFLSPTNIYYSLGLHYRYNDKSTLRISPLACKFIGTVDDRVDHHKIGLDSTQYHKAFFGYMVEAVLDWRISKEINIKSTIDFFNSYSKKPNIEFDWEVVGKFIINRFLSTRLSLIMRYDNTPIPDPGEKVKIQIQEQLSFGFSYNFR